MTCNAWVCAHLYIFPHHEKHFQPENRTGHANLRPDIHDITEKTHGARNTPNAALKEGVTHNLDDFA